MFVLDSSLIRSQCRILTKMHMMYTLKCNCQICLAFSDVGAFVTDLFLKMEDQLPTRCEVSMPVNAVCAFRDRSTISMPVQMGLSGDNSNKIGYM